MKYQPIFSLSTLYLTTLSQITLLPMKITRWLALVTAVYLQLSVGIANMYSVYSPHVNEKLHFGDHELHVQSIYKDVGINFCITAGLIYGIIMKKCKKGFAIQMLYVIGAC